MNAAMKSRKFMSVTQMGQVLVLLTLLSVVACASRAPVDPMKLAQLHVISLTGFSDPKFSPMTSGTLPVGKDLNIILAKQDLRLGSELKSSITSALRNLGYEVQEGRASSDATLDVKFGAVSYFAPPIIVGGGFGPLILVDVRVANSMSNEVIMRRTYMYQLSTYTGLTNYTPLAADQKYKFEELDALEKNPTLAADGLRAAIPLVTQSIAAELMRRE